MNNLWVENIHNNSVIINYVDEIDFGIANKCRKKYLLISVCSHQLYILFQLPSILKILTIPLLVLNDETQNQKLI